MSEEDVRILDVRGGIDVRILDVQMCGEESMCGCAGADC
jgi:hypothetical protein